MFWLLACAKQAVVAVPEGPVLAPHLPAPVGEVYVQRDVPAIDPLVAQALGGRPWSEVLSGAATALALRVSAGKDVTLADARWAAVRAGYPYTVDALRVVRTEREALPKLDLPAGQLGVVRARTSDGDVWIVLGGSGGPDLPPIPRELEVGASVNLGGLDWQVGTPSGEVRRLSGTVLFDEAGEWLLHASAEGLSIARLPVYVGEPTPETSPFDVPIRGNNPDDAAFNLISDVWAWYGREAPKRETGIDAVARVWLRDGGAARTLLARSGFVDGADGGQCLAPTLRECLEAMWWSPDDRVVFTDDFREIGVVTRPEGDGVRIVVMASR